MERQAVTVSISQNVDGIIICPAPGGEANIGLLRHYGKPFVLIGRRLEEETSYVICDDENSGYLAACYLMDMGHREILFLNGPKGISSAAERLSGYRRALRERGMPYNGRLVHTVPVTAGKGTERMRRALAGEQHYTAIFWPGRQSAFWRSWGKKCRMTVPLSDSTISVSPTRAGSPQFPLPKPPWPESAREFFLDSWKERPAGRSRSFWKPGSYRGIR